MAIRMDAIQVVRRRSLADEDGNGKSDGSEMWCKNCGGVKSASCSAGSVGSRWSSSSSLPASALPVDTDSADARERRAGGEDAQSESYCSPECFWSAELAHIGATGAHSNASSERSNSSIMTMGVNPFADTPRNTEPKPTKWDPSEGLRTSSAPRAVERNATQNADNAMFQFHAAVSSTFRQDLAFRV